MSETCIVCLGDLGENASALPLSAHEIVNDVDTKLAATNTTTISPIIAPQSPQLLSPESKSKSPESDSELIAHLLPCGHNLHDECLKPWVERANSCPICRQTFNQVELVRQVGGPAVSSYAVEDRTQVADVEPPIVEDEDELESDPCRVCGNDDNEDVLLICDGCNAAYHTYCVELTEVPSAEWWCEHCALHRAIEASLASGAPVPSRRQRRTRADVRSRRNNILARSSDWARVWETILDRTTIDLDFPHYNEHETPFRRSRTFRSRERRAWEQRLRVAEEQGGSRQLRHIAPTFEYDAPPSRPRPAPQEPESMEEIMAWNAMEKARDIEADPTGRSRKRRRTRSITASPSSPRPPPEPVPRKRPRTRRPHDVQEVHSDGGESSGSRRAPPFNHAINPSTNAGPSFLQSLLREVESSTPAEDEARGRPKLSLRAISDHTSPQGSSPEASPTNSNAPSPRAGSLSPAPRTRPGSPQLTSRIEPIYPHIGPLGDLSPVSPSSPTLANTERPKLKPKSRAEVANRTRSWVDTVNSSPTRAPEQSPTRLSMSLATKEKIQRLVKEALKEPYQKNQVDTDQYTDINRSVSRMLYDKIGESGDIEGDGLVEWQRLANEEVAKAVTTLNIQSD